MIKYFNKRRLHLNVIVVKILTLVLIIFFSSQNIWAADKSTLAYENFLDRIIQSHPQFLSAKMKLLAAQSAQLTGVLSPLPSLSVTAREPVGSLTNRESDSSQLLINLNLFRAGGDLFSVNSAVKSRKQSDLKIELAAINIQEAASKILFQWLELKQKARSQKSLVNSKAELLRVAKDRFLRGQLPAQEVEKVKLELSNTEIEIRQTEVELLNLQNELDTYLMGATEVQDWPWLFVAKKSVFKKVKAPNERIESTVLSLESEIAKQKSRGALSAWMPHIDFNSQLNSEHISPFKSGEWSNYISITFPIWDRGQSLADHRYWSYLKSAAESDQHLFQITEDVKLKSLRERYDKLQQNMQQAISVAEQSRNLAKESLRRFQLGRASVNDLSIDQARVYNSDLLAQQSIQQFHLVLLEMCVAADELPAKCFKE